MRQKRAGIRGDPGRGDQGRWTSRKGRHRAVLMTAYAIYVSFVLVASGTYLMADTADEAIDDDHHYFIPVNRDGPQGHYNIKRWDTAVPGSMDIAYTASSNTLNVFLDNIKFLGIDSISLFMDEGGNVLGVDPGSVGEDYFKEYFEGLNKMNINIETTGNVNAVEITDVEKSDHVKITGKGKGIVTWEFADGGVRISDIPAGVTQVDLYYDYSEYDWDRDGATDDVDPDDDDDGIPDDVEEALGSDPFDPEDLPGGLGADPTVETHTVNGHDVFVAYEGTGEIKVKQAGRTPDLPDHLAPTGIYLDITVSGGSLDRMVLSIDLGDVQVGPDENIGIYHYDEDRGEWVDIPGARYLRDTNKVVVVVDHRTLFAVVKVLGEERDVDTGDGDDGDGDTGEKENSSKGMDQFCAVAGLLMIIGLALFFWFSKRVNGKEEAKARDGKAGRGPPAARSGKDREDER